MVSDQRRLFVGTDSYPAVTAGSPAQICLRRLVSRPVSMQFIPVSEALTSMVCMPSRLAAETRKQHDIVILPYLLYYWAQNRGCSVGITTRLRAGQPRNWESILDKDTRLFSSPRCQNWLWEPFSFFLMGTGDFSKEENVWARRYAQSLPR
jgi:hypothetical protein